MLGAQLFKLLLTAQVTVAFNEKFKNKTMAWQGFRGSKATGNGLEASYIASKRVSACWASPNPTRPLSVT